MRELKDRLLYNRLMSAASITVLQHGSTAVVSVSGDLDLAIAEELRCTGTAQLEGEVSDAVEVDLSAVSFIDSSGLGCLVHLFTTAAKLGRPITLINIPAKVQRLIEIGGLQGILQASGPNHQSSNLN